MGNSDQGSLEFFKPRGNAYYNVHTDWLGKDVRYGIPDGFKAAADDVVNACADRNRYPDIFFHPVAYLYRHFMELRFKIIIRESRRLFDDLSNEGEPLGHDLKRLWAIAKERVMRAYPEGDASFLAPVDTAVEEFNSLDPDGQCFRYHENTKGNPNLANAPRIVSLDHLKEQMQKVYEILDGCEIGIRQYAENYEQFKREMGR